MRLTVAKRIVAGFAALTLLLFIGGASALFGLLDVESDQQQISQKAIPQLNTSNRLSLLLSKLETQLVHSLNASTIEGLQSYQDSFNELHGELSMLIKEQSQQAGGQTGELSESFDAYTAITRDFFDAREGSLKLGNQEVLLLEELTDLSDEAGGLLLDLMDETEGEQVRLSRVSGQLETALSSLVTASSELFKELSPEKAGNLLNELDNYVGNADSLYGDLKRIDSSDVDEDLINEIHDAVSATFALFEQGRSPQSIHQQRLTAIADTQKFAEQSLELQEALQATLSDRLLQTMAEADQLQTSLTATISRTHWLIIGVTLLSLVVAVSIAFATIRSILKPLSRVNSMLHTIAGGDLTQSLDESGQDEFSELSRNVNALVDSLRRLIQEITGHATQLAAAAEETSAITMQSTHGIQEQRLQIDQAASATTELNSSAEQVATNAGVTLSSVQQANDEAKNARCLSEESKEQIERLASELQSVSDVINRLAENSGQIGSVVDVIQTIAEQTNLLALNAAIEAARAGEQGRGFAVVADEVRALASRTQSSTTEIQEMIEKLQQGASEAVNSMQSSADITELCVTKSEDTDVALSAISDSVHAIHEQSHFITTAADEQQKVSGEIHHKLVQMVEIAEETSQGAEQTAKASEEVARLSDALQVSVSQFKL
ncbi:methyl-accepting chemotaxis protein [Corallincola platygyrae]|uniref:Methyl-accepting chemotaxis protein n=1 Tax=Corallincola platygyrae TaxID=1193278 RepID=A0ABW4XUF2_9GAMM